MNIAIITGGISSERQVALRSAENMENWVKISGHTVSVFDFPEGIDKFLKVYQSYELVIPVFHGVYGEDGQITAFLETLGCKYGYCDFETHALCMDKNLTNLFIEESDIRIPKSLFVKKDSGIDLDLLQRLKFPLIVKPNKGGSSIATAKTKDIDETLSAVEKIVEDDTLIQECIE